eukprot:403335264
MSTMEPTDLPNLISFLFSDENQKTAHDTLLRCVNALKIQTIDDLAKYKDVIVKQKKVSEDDFNTLYDLVSLTQETLKKNQHSMQSVQICEDVKQLNSQHEAQQIQVVEDQEMDQE